MLLSDLASGSRRILQDAGRGPGLPWVVLDLFEEASTRCRSSSSLNHHGSAFLGNTWCGWPPRSAHVAVGSKGTGELLPDSTHGGASVYPVVADSGTNVWALFRFLLEVSGLSNPGFIPCTTTQIHRLGPKRFLGFGLESKARPPASKYRAQGLWCRATGFTKHLPSTLNPKP